MDIAAITITVILMEHMFTIALRIAILQNIVVLMMALIQLQHQQLAVQHHQQAHQLYHHTTVQL